MPDEKDYHYYPDSHFRLHKKKYLSKPLTLLELTLLTTPNINNIADKSNSQHLMLLNQVFIGVYTTLRLYKYS